MGEIGVFVVLGGHKVLEGEDGAFRWSREDLVDGIGLGEMGLGRLVAGEVLEGVDKEELVLAVSGEYRRADVAYELRKIGLEPLTERVIEPTMGDQQDLEPKILEVGDGSHRKEPVARHALLGPTNRHARGGDAGAQLQ